MAIETAAERVTNALAPANDVCAPATRWPIERQIRPFGNGDPLTVIMNSTLIMIYGNW